MGVSIDSGGGKGGKKPLDAELNLVPFIDLLVCCICFLLITAVWSKMARIKVDQKSAGQGAKEEKPPEMQLKITVLISEDGYTLVTNSSRLNIDKTGEVYDKEKLTKELKDLKAQNMEKKDVTVAVGEDIKYMYIIETMDVALAAGFSSIKLKTAGTVM